MVQRTKRTLTAADKVLAKLSKGLSVSAACHAAGIGRTAYYSMLNDDPEFAKRAADAIEDGTDCLEDSATRQAIDGNAALMALLLKARRPEKYKDRSASEITGANGTPLAFVTTIRDHQPTPVAD